MASIAKIREQDLRAKSGEKVTSEVVDSLAEEAERGYDLTAAKRRKIGRPSLAGRGASPRLSFRTTPEMYQAAQERAEKEGRSVSELAREAVSRYVSS